MNASNQAMVIAMTGLSALVRNPRTIKYNMSTSYRGRLSGARRFLLMHTAISELETRNVTLKRKRLRSY